MASDEETRKLYHQRELRRQARMAQSSAQKRLTSYYDNKEFDKSAGFNDQRWEEGIKREKKMLDDLHKGVLPSEPPKKSR